MRSRFRRPAANDEGFSLIEVMAAMTVMAILAMVVAVTLTQSLQASRTSRQRVVAANVVAQQMDTIRNALSSSITPGVTSPTPVTVDGTTYSMTQTVRWVSGPDASVDTCSGTGSTLYKSVSIIATWPNMSGVQPVRSDTVLTPSLNEINPNYITIPIRVRDAGDIGRSGVAVTLSGTGISTSSQITDTNGCTIFANVPPGSYTATVTSSSNPPTVTWQGVSNYSFPVGTTVAGTWMSTYDFHWDTSVQLTLTPTGTSGYPVPAGVGATIYNANLGTANGTLSYPTTGSSVTATGLFPYNAGYSGWTSWAGVCSDADPSTQGSNRVPGTVVAPGGSAPVSLATRQVILNFSSGTTNRHTLTANGQTLVAVHTDKTGCGPVTYNGSSVGQVLMLTGTTNAAGQLQVSMPYGKWQFQVVGALPGPNATSSWVDVSIKPGTTPLTVPVSARPTS